MEKIVRKTAIGLALTFVSVIFWSESALAGDATRCVVMSSGQLQNVCGEPVEVAWCVDEFGGMATCPNGFTNQVTLYPGKQSPADPGYDPNHPRFEAHWGACMGANSIRYTTEEARER